MDSMQTINSSQDYINGVMYYTVQRQGENHLINSERKLIPFWLCSRMGIQLTANEITTARFSPEGITKFIDGSIKSDPFQIFTEIKNYISTYIYFMDKRIYTLLALWTMGTYVFRVFRYYPYIHVNAEKGSGKTTLMEILSPVCFNGDLSTDSTGASICEETHNNGSTLFLDEVEHLTAGRSNMLMRVLKSGFSKTGKVNRKRRFYTTYSPKMFAGIGEIEDVLSDRMIRIRMVKKLPSDSMEIFYPTASIKEWQSRIVDSLYIIGLQYGNIISGIYENGLKTTGLENRAWDLWAPILSIATLVGLNDEMIALSKDLTEEKDELDDSENESSRLVSILNAMLIDLTPAKVNAGINYYQADLVFSYFCAHDYFTDGETRTTLSRLLQRKLGIRCEPQKQSGMLRRMYAISPDVVRDYGRRYLPMEFQNG